MSRLNKKWPQTVPRASVRRVIICTKRKWRSVSEQLGLARRRGLCAVSLCGQHWPLGGFRADPHFSDALPQSSLRTPLEFILATCVGTSSWGWLRLRRHDNPSWLARSHTRQNWHSHRLCSADAQPVDGGPGTAGRGRRRQPVLYDRRRGAYGFTGSISGGFLSSCSYTEKETFTLKRGERVKRIH